MFKSITKVDNKSFRDRWRIDPLTGLFKISYLEATTRVLVKDGNVAIVGVLSDSERVFTETNIMRRIIEYSE